MGIPFRTTLPGGDLVAYAQSLFPTFKRWNGTAWVNFGMPLDAGILALVRLANGDLLAGGGFGNIGGTSARRIARWNGTTWSSVGGGIDAGIVSRVRAITEMPNGDIVIGGWFTTAGTVSANKIARWNGVSWSALGSRLNSNCYALAALSNGQLVAGGNFTLAGGTPANNIALWNGSNWLPMGSGTNDVVRALATLPGNHVIAGGSFTVAGGMPASRIAEWDGSSWSNLGTGVSGAVGAIAVLPSGDAIVGGGFSDAGGNPASCIARWNGTTWSPVGSGLDRMPPFGLEAVSALAVTSAGDIVAGGNFTAAAGNPVNRVANFAAGCPSSVSSYGVGCVSGAGPLVLTSTSLPVIANTFSLMATGFSAASIGVRLIGSSSTAIPLASVYPAGQAGCDLLVDANMWFDLSLPTASSLSFDIPLPNSPSLISLTAYAQVGSVELTALGDISGAFTSNGLAFVMGTF